MCIIVVIMVMVILIILIVITIAQVRLKPILPCPSLWVRRPAWGSQGEVNSQDQVDGYNDQADGFIDDHVQAGDKLAVFVTSQPQKIPLHNFYEFIWLLKTGIPRF